MPLIRIASDDLRNRYCELVDAINAARTDDEHYARHQYLDGFSEAMKRFLPDGIGHLIIDADMHVMAQAGNEERPMCGGILLDWSAPHA